MVTYNLNSMRTMLKYQYLITLSNMHVLPFGTDIETLLKITVSKHL